MPLIINDNTEYGIQNAEYGILTDIAAHVNCIAVLSNVHTELAGYLRNGRSRNKTPDKNC